MKTMQMDEDIKEKLGTISALPKHEIGDSEESVKINFVVPVLECLGHKGLDFEYKYKDIVIKKNLPKSSKVIVETKNYDKDINKELQQLERYCNEEQPLLGMIANGHEIRIFSPSWRFRDFRDTAIYCIKRENLNDENIINSLEKILFRVNLENVKAKEFVIEREKEIEDAEQEIGEIKEKFKNDEDELNVKIGKLNQEIKVINTQITNLTTQIADAESKRDEQIRGVREKLGLPVPSILPIPPIPPPIVLPVGEPPPVGQTVYVELPKPRHSDKQPSWRQHNLIPIQREYRSFFPGLKIDFSVDTDMGELKMYVTSAPKGTERGDPVAGWYIKGDTIKWLRHHSELKSGDRIKFTVIEPHKKYRLEIT